MAHSANEALWIKQNISSSLNSDDSDYLSILYNTFPFIQPSILCKTGSYMSVGWYINKNNINYEIKPHKTK